MQDILLITGSVLIFRSEVAPLQVFGESSALVLDGVFCFLHCTLFVSVFGSRVVGFFCPFVVFPLSPFLPFSARRDRVGYDPGM